MKNLNEQKEKLLAIEVKLGNEIESLGEQMGFSLTDDELDTDKIANQVTTATAKLHQAQKELIAIDKAIEAKLKAEEEQARAEAYQKRQDYIQSGCEGIREAWKLQNKLSETLQGVIENEEKAVIGDKAITLQARLMIGELMRDCRLHQVNQASVMGINKNLFPDSEISRLKNNLRYA